LTVRRLNAVVRLFRLVGHLFSGLRTLRRDFGGLTDEERQERVQQWSAYALEVLGVELEVRGSAPVLGPVLVVSNHVSWLDILVINAARPCRFVSKADVKSWPLLGRLVEEAGTLFIEREKRARVTCWRCFLKAQRGTAVRYCRSMPISCKRRCLRTHRYCQWRWATFTPKMVVCTMPQPTWVIRLSLLRSGELCVRETWLPDWISACRNSPRGAIGALGLRHCAKTSGSD
jgi:hypothetical protein